MSDLVYLKVSGYSDRVPIFAELIGSVDVDGQQSTAFEVLTWNASENVVVESIDSRRAFIHVQSTVASVNISATYTRPDGSSATTGNVASTEVADAAMNTALDEDLTITLQRVPSYLSPTTYHYAEFEVVQDITGTTVPPMLPVYPFVRYETLGGAGDIVTTPLSCDVRYLPHNGSIRTILSLTQDLRTFNTSYSVQHGARPLFSTQKMVRTEWYGVPRLVTGKIEWHVSQDIDKLLEITLIGKTSAGGHRTSLPVKAASISGNRVSIPAAMLPTDTFPDSVGIMFQYLDTEGVYDLANDGKTAKPVPSDFDVYVGGIPDLGDTSPPVAQSPVMLASLYKHHPRFKRYTVNGADLISSTDSKFFTTFDRRN